MGSLCLGTIEEMPRRTSQGAPRPPARPRLRTAPPPYIAAVLEFRSKFSLPH